MGGGDGSQQIGSECSDAALAGQMIAHESDFANLIDLFMRILFRPLGGLLWGHCSGSTALRSVGLRGRREMQRIPEALQLAIVIDRRRSSSPKFQRLQELDLLLRGVCASEGSFRNAWRPGSSSSAERCRIHELEALQASFGKAAVEGDLD